MERFLIKNSIFVFMFLWAVGIFFVWFRPKIEIFWKFVATMLFAFHVLLFQDELLKSYNIFSNAWYPTLIKFLSDLLGLLYFQLFVFWPVSLVFVFYKKDEIGAEKLLKFMSVFTLILVAATLTLVLYDKGVDKFLHDKVHKMVPGKILK
jgi:hypothetical protein